MVAFPSHPSGIGRLLLKNFLLSLPFTVVLASYLVLDPFQVLYHYQRFDKPQVAILNRDYVSTQMYLNTYKQRPYKSFVLGNSRTMAYRLTDWAPYVQDTMAFKYDASAESLYGVWKKLEFLQQHGAQIKNVLLICDADLLRETGNSSTPILQKDPRITGEFPARFQLSFLKSYFSDFFFYKYLKQRATGKFTPDMADILVSRRSYANPLNNDLTLPDVDAEIKRDSLGYYVRNDRVRMKRTSGVDGAVIGAAQLRQLVAVRNVFEKNHSNFQIVISPLLNQKQLNPADLTILQRVFGANRIHDFSGVNEFTAQVGYYYEESHYRPLVGREILRRIYSLAK